MSERGFFSASNDIKTLDGNIFSGFPWLTTRLLGKISTSVDPDQCGHTTSEVQIVSTLRANDLESSACHFCKPPNWLHITLERKIA